MMLLLIIILGIGSSFLINYTDGLRYLMLIITYLGRCVYVLYDVIIMNTFLGNPRNLIAILRNPRTLVSTRSNTSSLKASNVYQRD